MASPINVGRVVQPTSTRLEPFDGFDRSAEEPRRYLTQKKRIGRKTTAIKKSDTNMSAKKSASTWCALVEACGGKRWNLSILVRYRDRGMAGGRPMTGSFHKEPGAPGDRAEPSKR